MFQDYFTKQGGDICVQDLSSITAPTLVIHGMKDVMVAEEHVHHLAQNIPNSEKVRGARLTLVIMLPSYRSSGKRGNITCT